jgi:WD40 repeat protein
MAKSMAMKSMAVKERDKKTLLAQQAFIFNRDNGGKESDPDIYQALYLALKTWDDNTLKNLEEHTQNVRSLVSTNSGNYVFSAGSDGRIFKRIISSSGNTAVLLYHNPTLIHKAMAISDDETQLVVGGDYDYLLLIDLKHPESSPKKIVGNFKDSWYLTFSNQDKAIVSGGSDRKIYFWDGHETKEIFKSNSKINAIASLPSSEKIVMGDEEGTVYLFTISAMQYIDTLRITSSKSPIYSLAVNSPGNLLAIGNEAGEIFIWNMQKYILEGLLRGHNARVNKLCFSKDNIKLASGSFDKSVRIWSLSKMEDPPIVLNDHRDWVWSIAFSPSGERLLAGCRDNTIRVWPTNAAMLADFICGNISRNLTLEEWNLYVAPDIPYKKTCAQMK